MFLFEMSFHFMLPLLALFLRRCWSLVVKLLPVFVVAVVETPFDGNKGAPI
jgi:hypothetical protein